MTNWRESDEAASFIASADSRETDTRIIEAIAFNSRSLEEAERIWDLSSGIPGLTFVLAIWEHATSNGSRSNGSDMQWGRYHTLADVLHESKDD